MRLILIGHLALVWMVRLRLREVRSVRSNCHEAGGWEVALAGPNCYCGTPVPTLTTHVLSLDRTHISHTVIIIMALSFLTTDHLGLFLEENNETIHDFYE